ncbi:hypothetical protein [Pseudomonas sp. NPDC087615]|uniref:hypothetical protein n=1 Tax=Pseudomonas sp. NPDC087615 TaxID=3364443 RepID=UPI00380D79A9
MNASTYQFKKKNWLSVRLKKAKKCYSDKVNVSIYPFILTILIALLSCWFGGGKFVGANVTVENLYFGVVVSAVCVATATVIRVFRNGLLRRFTVRVLLFFSNIATDIAYGALGFYIGRELFWTPINPEAWWWLSGAIAYWIAINILYFFALKESESFKRNGILALITVGCAISTWFLLDYLMRVPGNGS